MSTDINIDTLARTLYGEARGEGQIGMQAVANVVLNRVELSGQHPHFGNGTIASACKAPWQFSCWNENDPNLHTITNVGQSDLTFSGCLQIASDATNGLLVDNTGGATYYYVKNSPEPAWAIDKTPCAIIGKHLFFKDIA
jgi:N-acetylmuramoyl-L-alanine amidase